MKIKKANGKLKYRRETRGGYRGGELSIESLPKVRTPMSTAKINRVNKESGKA